MILVAALAVALVRTALPAFPAMSGDVRLSADHVTYEVGTGRVLLEGNAVVQRGMVVLRARSASWDPATAEVRAAGGVLLTDATRAISADAIRAVIGGESEAEGVLAFVKNRPVDLSGLRTAEEARRTGRNRVTFSGQRLRGSSAGRLTLTRARLTLCDCPGGAPPSWEVTAREADVIPGERAILKWPIVRIAPRFVDRTVPVLVLPWLYLPLGERQSGLLLPTIGSTGATGFSIAQPVYVTLGRSADATLTPEYAFGVSRADVAKGSPAVRGPGARLELRFTPAQDAEGRAELAWIHDLDAEPGGASGDRWALSAIHGQRLGDRTTLHAGLRLAGDAVWVRDTTSDALARALPYRRSDLLVSHRAEEVVLEAAASYDQPLRPAGSVAPPPGAAVPIGTFPTGPYGPLGADVGVASRWGSAAATLLPVASGPLRLSARAGAARFADLRPELDVVGRPGATRADARVEVSAPLLLRDAVTVSPFVRGAALGYAFDEARDPRAVAWVIGGAFVESEVSRRYGPVRHAIVPRLEWRAGTGAAGDVLPFPAYDAQDRSSAALLSATPGVFQQLRATLENRLDLGGRTLARAEVGQDLDLRAGRPAETFASLGVAAGPVSGDASARFLAWGGRPIPAPPPRLPAVASPFLDRFTELRTSVAVRNRRGDGLHAGFLAVGSGGSGTLVAGLDPLFDLRPAAVEPAALATAGLSATIAGAKVGYEARFPGRAVYVDRCEGAPGAQKKVGAAEVREHTATLAWESSCHCFAIRAFASVTDCGVYKYHASLDLSGLAGALMR